MFASKEVLSLDELYKAQNEINRIKQSLLRAALFGEGSEPSDVVESRERLHNFLYFQLSMSARLITIYDFVGQPFYRPSAELSAVELSQEVDRLLLLLAQNGIEITVSDPHANADDRKLHSFITEVVFSKEVRDIRLPGICYSIDYNYYCPDHTHACIYVVDEFLTGLFKSDYRRFEFCLAENFFINNDPREELYRYVRTAFDAYKKDRSDYRLVGWTVESVDLDEGQRKGVVHLELHYGLKGHKTPLITEKGLMECYGQENNWWFIHRIDWPGLLLE
ncbi:hypothetical protein ACFQ4C_05135 [Larkinella insperata]|uniref:Uncharacterized protein n=1 Tax=Larkinella insperata TaxID=332158 RepID=A0ABW3Q0Z2_9BACT|nr:hypothetical protein [Larkinella insperata]